MKKLSKIVTAPACPGVFSTATSSGQAIPETGGIESTGISNQPYKTEHDEVDTQRDDYKTCEIPYDN